MFESAKVAGLTPVDVARELGVSRVTASMWFNGHYEPMKFLRPHVQELLDAIGRAVEAGELPVPVDVTRRERAQYLSKVLRRHLPVAEADTRSDLV